MAIRSRTWPTAALIACLAAFTGGVHAADPTTPAYLNTSLPPQVRAADLVHRMTLQEKVSQLVNGARAIPHLGVSSYNWWSEALHGVAVNGTTEFPEPVGLGATFDAPGIHEMAHDIGIEGRVVHEQAVRAGGSFTASTSGRPTSISSVTRAGGAARRPTARTPSSPRIWRWRT
jgi:beta-glucosidase